MRTKLILLFLAVATSILGEKDDGKSHDVAYLKRVHSYTFLRLAEQLKEVDRKARSTCSRYWYFGKYWNSTSREIIDTDWYMVSTRLDGYSETDFEIKIRGRAMYTTGNNAGSGYYSEVRELPTFVEPGRAVYVYYAGELNVVFPFDHGACACDLPRAGADADVTVPMMAQGNQVVVTRPFGFE